MGRFQILAGFAHPGILSSHRQHQSILPNLDFEPTLTLRLALTLSPIPILALTLSPMPILALTIRLMPILAPTLTLTLAIAFDSTLP